MEEFNGDQPCPTFIISEDEEKRLSKPWKNTLIIKLLRRKIGFKALEAKLY